MDNTIYSIKPLEMEYISNIVEYWENSSAEHLVSMGVALNKCPNPSALTGMLINQLKLPNKEKDSLAVVWLKNNKPIGHCNVNQISFSDHAKIHLHIWGKENRLNGVGSYLFKKSISYFFKELQLKQIFCEPYSKNQAPNRTLKAIGFKLLKTYTTTPGSINFEQEVNQWRLNSDDFI